LRSIYASGFFAYAAAGVIFPVISPYARYLGASESLSAIIAGSFALVTAVLMTPFGFYSDRYGRGNFIITGLFLYVTAPLLYIYSFNPIILLTARLVHGLGMAMYVPAVNALIADLSPVEKRGEAFGWLSATFMLGFVFGPFTGGLFFERFGITTVFLLSSLYSILSFVAVTPHLRKELSHAVNTERFILTKRLGSSFLATFSATFGSAAVAIFAIPFYAPELNLNASAAGMAISLLFLSSAIARVPAGLISDRFGREIVILSGLIMESIAIFFLMSQNNLQLFVFTAVSGIGMGFTNTACFALASESESRGFAMGIVNSSLNAGIFAGPAVTGFVAQFFGYQGVFYLSSAIILLSTLPVFLLIRTSD
jgi:MFS family permease